MAVMGYEGSQAQWNAERAAISRQMREREKQERKEAVTRLRGEAQAAADDLRMKRESLPTLNTAQTVTGDVELDLLVRKYQRAVDAFEQALNAAAMDERDDE